MKRFVIFLIVAYLLSLGYFFINRFVFIKEIKQWEAYKEVVYNFSINTQKHFHYIKPINDAFLVVAVTGNYSKDDIISIENWTRKTRVFHGSVIIDTLAAPDKCDIHFYFNNSDSSCFSENKIAYYSCIPFVYSSENGKNYKIFKYSNKKYSYPKTESNPTTIEISTKYSTPLLRDFIIKQSVIFYLGIYKDNIEFQNYFDRLTFTKRLRDSNNNYTWIGIIDDNDEYRKLKVVFDNNFGSQFEWKELLEKVEKQSRVKIKESDIKQKNKLAYQNFMELSLFTPQNNFTNLDKYILDQYNYGNYPIDFRKYYTEDISEFYPLKVQEINNTVKTISFWLLVLVMVALYLSGFFEKLASLIVSDRSKHIFLFSNIRDFIPIFIFLIISYLHTHLLPINSISHYFGVGSNFFNREVILFIEIIILLNVMYLIERKAFSKSNQFFKKQWFILIAIPICVVVTYGIASLFLPNKYAITLINAGLFIFIFLILRFYLNTTNYQKKQLAEVRNQELSMLKELKTRAELNAIQSRINPHFLYNSLNSIAGLAHEDADKVEQMALALSKLFRYSINKDDSDYASVKSEVEMALLYLEIEKVRFGNRLNYEFNVPQDVEDVLIPRFLIQPLVENAIKHGISNNPDYGLLKLDILNSENDIKIAVYDNGPDFPKDVVTGYGLKSIYDKLDILYPGEYDIQIQNSPEKNICISINKPL